MAHHKSAIKRIQLSAKQNARNKHYKSAMKTLIKKVLSHTKKEEAQADYIAAVSLLDKLVGKGIIHKNNAANKKSRISTYLNSLA